jgi:hypothetical protein
VVFIALMTESGQKRIGPERIRLLTIQSLLKAVQWLLRRIGRCTIKLIEYMQSLGRLLTENPDGWIPEKFLLKMQ